METQTLIQSTSSSLPFFAPKPFKPFFSAKPTLLFSSSSSSSLYHKKSAIVYASKKKNKKQDSHSFIPREDEATGPFPEAVLLKQRKVEKDGEFFPEFADDDEEMVYQILKLQLEDDMEEDRRLRHYEVVYLIHEKHDDEVESVTAKINDFLREKKGMIWRINDWGMRRLAYKIQKAKNAHYFLMNFEMEAKWINDFKTMLDKDERVIRHLVMKRDEAITKDCPPPPEFHTLRAGIDDDDYEQEEEGDMDYDDDEEYDEEDWDGEDEDEDEIDGENGIIFVNGDQDEEDDRTRNLNGKTRTSKSKAEKVGR